MQNSIGLVVRHFTTVANRNPFTFQGPLKFLSHVFSLVLICFKLTGKLFGFDCSESSPSNRRESGTRYEPCLPLGWRMFFWVPTLRLNSFFWRNDDCDSRKSKSHSSLRVDESFNTQPWSERNRIVENRALTYRWRIWDKVMLFSPVKRCIRYLLIIPDRITDPNTCVWSMRDNCANDFGSQIPRVRSYCVK
jgi:hypothetical protein